VSPTAAGSPQDEIVDVVDDADRVIGQATRRDIRRYNLRHRSVYVLVFNTRGELFVHERTPNKDVYPGYRDVAVGGVLRAGEDYATAAVRECGEELGIEGIVPELLFSMRYQDGANSVNGNVYRAFHDGPFRLDPAEIVSGGFIPIERIPALAQTVSFCPDGLAALAQFQRRGAGGRA
jgi:isopentenyldiphosphate isomerase